MHFHQALESIVSGQNLDAGSMRDVMREIMSGNTTDAQIGAFLVALRIKGESIDEITGAVEVMRELATGVEVSGDYLVDIVGTLAADRPVPMFCDPPAGGGNDKC